MANVLLLNGPNLNLLGEREPDLYGHDRLPDLELRLTDQARSLGHTLACFQSNHEGMLIDRLHEARRDGTTFLLFNPGGYTHTSVALRDAVLAVTLPFIEIHVSNVYARERFRRRSHFSDLAVGTIAGFGTQGYELALSAAHHYLRGRIA